MNKRFTDKMKKSFVYVLIAIMLLALASCGNSGVSTDPVNRPEYNGSNGLGDISDDISEKNQSTDINIPNSELKIIYTASVVLQTQDYDNCVIAIKNSVNEYSGYVSSSTIGENDIFYSGYYGYRTAQFTVRIPSALLDAYIESINTYGHIYSSSISSADVTSSYYDIAARVKSLEAYEEKLYELYESADKDMALEIFKEIQSTRSDIDSMNGQIKLMDNQVEYSTVTININEVSKYTDNEKANQTWGERIVESCREQFIRIGEGMEDFLVWLAGSFIGIIFWGAIIVVAIIIIVRYRRKKRASRNEGNISEPTDGKMNR